MTLLDGETYSMIIWKKEDSTYSSISKCLKFFEEENLITSRKKGRIKFVTLTKEGRSIASGLNKISKKLQNLDFYGEEEKRRV